MNVTCNYNLQTLDSTFVKPDLVMVNSISPTDSTTVLSSIDEERLNAPVVTENQSINQYINLSIIPSMNQSINQSINQSFN